MENENWTYASGGDTSFSHFDNEGKIESEPVRPQTLKLVPRIFSLNTAMFEIISCSQAVLTSTPASKAFLEL